MVRVGARHKISVQAVAPLREALLKLEGQGLVKIIPRKGTFVRPITPRLIREMFTIRAWLEGLAARLAAERQGSALAEPLEAMIKRIQEAGGVQKGTSFSMERLMLPFLNEAAMCVQENIANVNDVDMACIAGIGMQVNKGGQAVRMGPLEYMDELGLDVVVQKLEELEKQLGPRFHPVNILYQKVRAGDLGKKTKRGFKEYTV